MAVGGEFGIRTSSRAPPLEFGSTASTRPLAASVDVVLRVRLATDCLPYLLFQVSQDMAQSQASDSQPMSGSLMSRPIYRCLIVVALGAGVGSTLGGAQESVNPTFNFEGIEAFWDIVSILDTDTEPTHSQWNDLFEAPGYGRLAEEFGHSPTVHWPACTRSSHTQPPRARNTKSAISAKPSPRSPFVT